MSAPSSDITKANLCAGLPVTVGMIPVPGWYNDGSDHLSGGGDSNAPQEATMAGEWTRG